MWKQTSGWCLCVLLRNFGAYSKFPSFNHKELMLCLKLIMDFTLVRHNNLYFCLFVFQRYWWCHCQAATKSKENVIRSHLSAAYSSGIRLILCLFLLNPSQLSFSIPFHLAWGNGLNRAHWIAWTPRFERCWNFLNTHHNSRSEA